MRSLWRPLHLLLLDHALTHHLVDRGRDERGPDPFPMAIPVAVVDDGRGVIGDVRHQFIVAVEGQDALAGDDLEDVRRLLSRRVSPCPHDGAIQTHRQRAIGDRQPLPLGRAPLQEHGLVGSQLLLRAPCRRQQMVAHGDRTVLAVYRQHVVQHGRGAAVGCQGGPFRLQLPQLGAAACGQARRERSKRLLRLPLAGLDGAGRLAIRLRRRGLLRIWCMRQRGAGARFAARSRAIPARRFGRQRDSFITVLSQDPHVAVIFQPYVMLSVGSAT